MLKELKELASKTPAELWAIYPDKVKYEHKVMVEIEKSLTEPELVFRQLVDFIKVPRRKPYLLDRICKLILKKINQEVK